MSHWKENNNSIVNTFICKSFSDSITFVNLIATEAERMQHHPDIHISYDHVKITLTTHDADGVTEKDHELAKIIDMIYNKYI